MGNKVVGFQQIVAATLASATALTVPAGATKAHIQAESANVRWRADGEDPTTAVGMIVLAGAHQPLELTTGLNTAKFIAESGSPKLNVTYFGTDN